MSRTGDASPQPDGWTEPTAGPTLLAGLVTEDWAGDARYAEYTAAADPLATGAISRVPIRRFSADLHRDGPSRIVDLDCSDELGTTAPATTPALRASFVVLVSGVPLVTEPEGTSELYYCLSGDGTSSFERTGPGPAPVEGSIAWSSGDVVVLPAGCRVEHRAAAARAVLYRVSDAPLLRYLGAVPDEARFGPTRYPARHTEELLAEVAKDPGASQRSRVSVLLGNAAVPDTLTVTHVLWAMVGILPAGATQRPHRHQSVAVDLITWSLPGCYTLVGTGLDADGDIVDPVRVDWETGGAFITPPGLWHSHHNESGTAARLVPIQDAGLHTYLRSLDIRFSDPAR